MNKGNSDRAVSPVIGVILLVALTVALVALAATVVFDISSDTGNAGAAAVDYDHDTDSLEVISEGNADEIWVDEVDEGEEVSLGSNSMEDHDGETDVILVVDGDEQLYGSFDMEDTAEEE